MVSKVETFNRLNIVISCIHHRSPTVIGLTSSPHSNSSKNNFEGKLFGKMLSLLDVGLRRELQSIITIYLSLLLQGYSSGFSAVAVPDMKEEMERRWRLEGGRFDK